MFLTEKINKYKLKKVLLHMKMKPKTARTTYINNNKEEPKQQPRDHGMAGDIIDKVDN